VPEQPIPEQDPITSKSYAAYYVIATVILVATLFWALWDEAWGQRPWKAFQEQWKTRYSAFFDTDLHATLMAMKVDTLVVCGLTTECCVDCTVRDAFQLDYQVFIAADACAAYEPDLHQGALKALALNCAIVVETNDVVGAWLACS